MDTDLQFVQDEQDRGDGNDGDGDCAKMIMTMTMVILFVHDDGDDAQIENFVLGSLFSTSPASAFVRAALLKSKAGNEVWEMKTRSSVKHKNKLYPSRKSEQNLFGIVDPRH